MAIEYPLRKKVVRLLKEAGLATTFTVSGKGRYVAIRWRGNQHGDLLVGWSTLDDAKQCENHLRFLNYAQMSKKIFDVKMQHLGRADACYFSRNYGITSVSIECRKSNYGLVVRFRRTKATAKYYIKFRTAYRCITKTYVYRACFVKALIASGQLDPLVGYSIIASKT